MSQTGPLAWLLETENPSARYLALTGLLGRSADDPDAAAARAAIPGWGPARDILDAQWPGADGGYWMRPGAGYSPPHKATVWQVIFLAALGAPRGEQVDRACAYLLGHSRLPDGRFSAYAADRAAPGSTARGAILCLNGNLLRAMLQLGYDDPRLDQSLEALANMVVRDRFCCRFNASRPLPARMGDGLPCAWGAIKALGALAEVAVERRSPAMRAAARAGVDFLLGGGGSPPWTENLASGHYPTATEPSPLWLKFGFPLGKTADLLEALEVLPKAAPAVAAPFAPDGDPGLASALAAVLSKQKEGGRWLLEYTPDNTWTGFGRIGQPNKWVTLRALRALQAWDQRLLSNAEGTGEGRENTR